MKKNIFILAVLLGLFSCKQQSKENVQLSGFIKGLKKGTLYIQRVSNNKLVAIDTIVMNGEESFETNLTLESPEMLYLFLDRGVSNSLDNNIAFFAEPGILKIESELESFITSAKITGSKNQTVYNEYQKTNLRFRDANLDFIKQKFDATKSNNSKRADSLTLEQDKNTKRKYLFATNFAVNHKDLEVAPYIALSDIYDINVKYLDTIQKSLSPKVAKSLYGKKLTEYITAIKKAK